MDPSTGADNIMPANIQASIDQTDLLDWNTVKERFTTLINRFDPEIKNTNFNRITRYSDISIKEYRDQGKLKSDEMVIPIRLIDTNIRREQPAYITYLKQSKRLATFTDKDDSSFIPDKVEEEFTRGLEYNGWERPFFKEIDGAQTHGWDSIEVVVDHSKPFNLGIEHIGHENLIFEVDCIDIQWEEILIRRYNTVTPMQLKEYVRDYGFSQMQVDTVLNRRSVQDKDSPVLIYKAFLKASDPDNPGEKIIFCGWFSLDAQDWLKPPKPYYLGMAEKVTIPSQLPGILPDQESWKQTPLTSFPIFLLPYYETEKPRIMDHDGRVFLDKYKQEALTTGWSSFVNALIRSSGVYASRKNPSDPQGKAKLESIVLEHGKIITQNIDFFQLPYPNPEMLATLQALDIQNSQEVGQLTYAANNRQDSRKTATEINQASQDQTMLSSVQLTLFSTHIRELCIFLWTIVQSLANQGIIKFLADPRTGQNDLASINRDFDIKAAGDTDVVKRQELLAKYMGLLPVITQTPIAIPYIAKILKLSLDDDGEVFANMLVASTQNDQGKTIIESLIKLVQGMATEQELNTLSPEDRKGLEQVLQTAQAYLSSSSSSPMNSSNTQQQNANTQSNVGSGAGTVGQGGSSTEGPPAQNMAS